MITEDKVPKEIVKVSKDTAILPQSQMGNTRPR